MTGRVSTFTRMNAYRPFNYCREVNSVLGASDPYYANVVALLKFNGTNGSTTFTDLKGKTWTPTGNAQISTAQSKFGGSSLRLDGTGDFLDCVGGADFNFGVADFTIDFWIYLNSASQDMLLVDSRFGGVSASYALYDNNSAGQCNVTLFANSNDRAATPSLAAATWYFIELSRVSGQTRLFLDGTQFGSTYADSNNYTSTQLRLGHNFTATSASASGFNGWIDEFRVTKGVGRHTTNFTPPTASFPEI